MHFYVFLFFEQTNVVVRLTVAYQNALHAKVKQRAQCI